MSCPICNLETTRYSSRGSVKQISCPRCGNYEITEMAEAMITGSLSEIQIANVSHWIRTNNEPTLSSTNIEMLKNLPSPTIGEKARRCMFFLSKHYPKPGEYIDSVYRKDPLYYSIIGCFDETEFLYIVDTYLIEHQGYLTGSSPSGIKITPSGWAYLESLKNINPDSQIGFIAMWFNDELNTFLEVVREGILDAGYNPQRVDDIEHNEDINDKIIASIRQSKFVVADFTEQRAGVYFEAGYARGLGLEVIWLCREDDFDNIHFDNEHYNFIKWHNDNLEDLKEKLTNRIIATIGKGTYNPE